MDDNWDDQFEYLKNSRFLYHNDDYLEFLVARVWQIDSPMRIVDFGCGFGWLGMKLLPLIPEGSSYTGIDISPALLEKARETYAHLPYPTEFIRADVHSVPLLDNQFDLAVCHALLMHVRNAPDVLDEMIRLVVDGGRVIACEGTRLAHMAAYHTTGPFQPPYDLGIMQTFYDEIARQETIDYNIGFRLPALMSRAGLADISCRVSDTVRCHLPTDNPANSGKIYDAISKEGYGISMDDAAVQKARESYCKYGIPRETADRYLDQIRQQVDDFIAKGQLCDIVYPGLMAFTSGIVRK